MSFPAILAFEDGSVFQGIGYGKEKYDVGEIVFNTSMSGYQEIITDPSYKKQIITFTHPHIGNTGTNKDDSESEMIVLVLSLRFLKKMQYKKQKTFLD